MGKIVYNDNLPEALELGEQHEVEALKTKKRPGLELIKAPTIGGVGSPTLQTDAVQSDTQGDDIISDEEYNYPGTDDNRITFTDDEGRIILYPNGFY